MVWPSRTFPTRIADSAPIATVIAPVVRGVGATRVTRISPAQALAALAPSSILQIPGAGESALAQMAGIVRTVPCWQLELGADRAAVPRRGPTDPRAVGPRGTVTPLVSVIVPTYNSERYLDETLRSVLEQSRAPDEVIVVDDGSTDATERVAGEFSPQVTVIAGDHVGTPKNRDRGWRAASGELIAMCDSDDLWMPQKLEVQSRWLEERPGSRCRLLLRGRVHLARRSGGGHGGQGPTPETRGPIRFVASCQERLHRACRWLRERLRIRGVGLLVFNGPRRRTEGCTSPRSSREAPNPRPEPQPRGRERSVGLAPGHARASEGIATWLRSP